MKKTFTAVLALLLVIFLVACDDLSTVTEYMGKMGECVIENTALVDNVVKATEVGGESVEDGRLTLPGSKSDESKVEIEFASDKVVISVGEQSINLPALPAGVTVEAVLPVTDLSQIVANLDKPEVLEALAAPVTDEETIKAAEGTKAVMSAFLGMVPEEVMEGAPELFGAVAEILAPATEENPLTKEDVVVLSAVSNIIYNSADSVVAAIVAMNDSNVSEEVVAQATADVITGAYDDLFVLIDVAGKTGSLGDLSALVNGFLK